MACPISRRRCGILATGQSGAAAIQGRVEAQLVAPMITSKPRSTAMAGPPASNRLALTFPTNAQGADRTEAAESACTAADAAHMIADTWLVLDLQEEGVRAADDSHQIGRGR